MTFKKLTGFLNIDNQEFLFQFQSHPNYPSALAFSDTLNFLGIKNDAYDLEKKYWDELPEEYIAIVNNVFTLVKKSGNSYNTYSENVKNINKDELYRDSTDFVLLFEITDNLERKSTVNFKPLVYIVFILIALYSVFALPLYQAVFNILSLVGVYISLEIFNQKFGTTSTIVSNICGMPTSTKEVNSCNKIIQQDKTNILGLKFADFSLIYFVSLTLLGLFIPTTSYVIIGLSSLSLIVIFYSLYIQGFVEKAFCKICLLIISILLAQLIISTLFFGVYYFKFESIFLGMLFLLISLAIVMYLNTILTEKEELQKSNTKNLRFKRNYELFKNELFSKEKINFPTKDPFFIGNKKAKLHISIVSNPYCGFCKEAHKIMQNLIEKYPNDISAQIRFNYFPEKANEKYDTLITNFLKIYQNTSEQEFVKSVNNWFEHKDENIIHQISAAIFNHEDLQPIFNVAQENIKMGLSFTPIIIINEYRFPDKYDNEDIYYFIDELLDDDEI